MILEILLGVAIAFYAMIGIFSGIMDAVYGSKKLRYALTHVVFWPLWGAYNTLGHRREMRRIARSLTEEDFATMQDDAERDGWKSWR